MNKRELTKLIKRHLLPAFPEFTLSKTESDLFVVPMNHLYRAFTFSGSAHSRTSFRINAAIMPLYVPSEFYHVTFGKRLLDGNTDTWEWTADGEDRIFERVREALKTQGMARIGHIQSPLDFARMQPKLSGETFFNLNQAVAYSLIYAGVFDEAELRMEALHQEWERLGSDLAPWAVVAKARDFNLNEVLQNDPQAARALLLDWEQQSIKNLKLEGYVN